MTDLPEGWAWATVEEIAATSLGKMLDAKQQTGANPTRYLRNINVRWGAFDLSDVALMDVAPHELERILARDGDVIACEGGEPGRAAVWRGDPIALQKALHRIRPGAGIRPDYLALGLRTQATTGGLDELFTGTTIKHLPQEKLRMVVLPLAPTAEQERIVAAIEEAFSKLDAGAAGLHTVRRLLERMRTAVLTAAVTGDWPVRPLKDVTSSQDYGISAKAHEEPRPDDVPVLRMGNIQGGAIAASKLKFVDPSAKDVASRMLVAGDLLFNRTNSAELVGKSAVYTGTPANATFASYLIRVRTTDEALPEWCALVINSTFGRGYIASVVSQQVGQANVNGTKLSQFPMPLPRREEQERIVAEVERQFSFIDACEHAVDAGLTRAAALRRSVLKTAFEGRLVPQDPTDEPASALLDRIRAERAADPPTRRARRRNSEDGRTPSVPSEA